MINPNSKGSSLAALFDNINDMFDVTGLLLKTEALAVLLIPIFIIGNITMNIINSFIGYEQKKTFIDMIDIKRVLMTLFLMGIVPSVIALIGQIGYYADLFIKDNDESGLSSFLTVIETLWTSGDTVHLWSDGISTIIFCALMVLVVIITIILKYSVYFYVGILFKYIIVISPLACAFSIIPMFKDKVQKLFSLVFNLSFVMLTLRIIDILFFEHIFVKIAAMNNFDIKGFGDIKFGLLDFKNIVFFAVCIIMVSFYVTAMYLTSKYAGNPGGAAVVQAMTSIATMAATAAMGIGALKGIGGGGKGGGMKDIVKNLGKGLGGGKGGGDKEDL